VATDRLREIRERASSCDAVRYQWFDEDKDIARMEEAKPDMDYLISEVERLRKKLKREHENRLFDNSTLIARCEELAAKLRENGGSRG
jgi:hypothetical protein